MRVGLGQSRGVASAEVCSSLPKDKPKREFRDMIRGWTETRGTKVPST